MLLSNHQGWEKKVICLMDWPCTDRRWNSAERRDVWPTSPVTMPFGHLHRPQPRVWGWLSAACISESVQRLKQTHFLVRQEHHQMWLKRASSFSHLKCEKFLPYLVHCRELFLSWSFNCSSETHHRYSHKSSTGWEWNKSRARQTCTPGQADGAVSPVTAVFPTIALNYR